MLSQVGYTKINLSIRLLRYN